MKILADASLPGLLQAFPKPFELSLYRNKEEIPQLLGKQDILVCRSTLRVNESLLNGHPLTYVATASSGTDHIDTAFLASQGTQLIDAKGSNAQAVADYVIASLAYLRRDQGFSGVNAAVVGVGEVGSRVAKRLEAAGLKVLCYDPPKASQDPTFRSCPPENLKQCDLICIHANLHDTAPHPSRNLFDETLLKQLKPGVVIINAARGDIVNESALLSRPALSYCTDVYSNEPAISREIVNFATLCTPHIAGHSIEAKLRAIHMISAKLHACLNLKPPVWQSSFDSRCHSHNDGNDKTSLKLITMNPALTSKNCQDFILSLYNPLNETILLKAVDNLESGFQYLRKAHQNRHEFCNFAVEETNEPLG